MQAHPAQDSLSSAVFEAVVDELARLEYPFAPVRIGQGDQLTADSFASTERVIAIYPTWFGSLPAMFLAAMADVIAPWVDSASSETSPLRAVRSLKVVTSHGSSKLINRVQGEPGMQLWKRTVLPLCAPGATFEWKALYKVDRGHAASRSTFIEEAAHFATR